MDEQQIINRGSDAEEFKRYIDDNPYFNSVVALSKELILQNIMALRPDEQMKFTVLKSQDKAIDELMNLIEIDISEGKKAIDRMQSETGNQKTYGEGDIL